MIIYIIIIIIITIMNQKEEVCKINVANEFIPVWINILCKSVMNLLNKYAPGFVFVGRKCDPFLNERHKICCAVTSILWRE